MGVEELALASDDSGDVSAVRAEPPQPGHLLKFSNGDWALWRTVGLRGAGFPAHLVLELASAEASAAADRVANFFEESEAARAVALAALSDIIEATPKELRDPYVKVLRRLKRRQPPTAAVDAGGPFDRAAESFRLAVERHAEARAEFEETFRRAQFEVSRRIKEVVGRADFQEAVIWQNRHAYVTGVKPLLESRPDESGRDARRRGREDLIASYVQRYCVKNDTIGFFGPVGWARLVDTEGVSLSLSPGEQTLSARTVYFEGWGLDALARKLSADAELRPWMAPRLMPYVHVEGTTLHTSHASPSTVSPKQAAVLKACASGLRPARELAAGLLADAALGFRGEREVYLILEYLLVRGLITWEFEVPTAPKPERHLRALLERIGDERLRLRAAADFAEFERARLAVAEAAGDPPRLAHALDEMEQTFTRLTGSAGTRGHGKTYAGRTLVYEDSRRDVEVELGPELWRELEAPLTLMLTSARWYTHEVARVYGRTLNETYDEVVRETGSTVVEGLELWRHIQRLFFNDEGTLVQRLIPSFQERWLEALRLPENQWRVSYTAEELRPRVEAAFPAPRSGWQVGRYHSPDVMIAADGAEAVRRGDYQFVLGELHLGVNTLGSALFKLQHPRPESFEEAVVSDLPAPRLVPLQPKSWPLSSTRVIIDLHSARDYRLALTYDSVPGLGDRVLPIGELVVERVGGELMVRAREGRPAFPFIEALGETLSALGVNSFKMLPPWRHRPRINVGRLVVSRESWSFSPAEMGFADLKDEAERFAEARRWARGQGMPRFVFVKVPVETKPFYVDFDSPLFVGGFAKMIRRTAEHRSPDALITMSEMLPGADQSWLHDAAGRRYTSELRIVALDLIR